MFIRSIFDFNLTFTVKSYVLGCDLTMIDKFLILIHIYIFVKRSVEKNVLILILYDYKKF